MHESLAEGWPERHDDHGCQGGQCQHQPGEPEANDARERAVDEGCDGLASGYATAQAAITAVCRAGLPAYCRRSVRRVTPASSTPALRSRRRGR